MTDKEKLEKIVAYLMRRMYAHNQKADIGSTGEIFDEKIENAKYEECRDTLNFIDSMQEECNITSIKSKDATGKLKECINNVSEESLAKARKQLQEEPKECMYSKDNYTAEDRKVLCEGCEEECKFNKKEEPVSIWHDASEKSNEPEEVVIINPSDNTGEVVKRCTGVYQGRIWAYTSVLLNLDNPCKIGKKLQEEPVSEDLEQAAADYENNMWEAGHPEDTYTSTDIIRAVKFGANWQKQKDDYAIEIAHMAGEEEGKNIMKQQMMEKAVDIEVKVDAGGYPYVDRTIELYDYDKDIPLAKGGDKYKVILIKEE